MFIQPTRSSSFSMQSSFRHVADLAFPLAMQRERLLFARSTRYMGTVSCAASA